MKICLDAAKEKKKDTLIKKKRISEKETESVVKILRQRTKAFQSIYDMRLRNSERNFSKVVYERL